MRPGSHVSPEHAGSEEPGLARWQDRLHGIHLRIGHGCHCNRPTLEFIEAAGFSVEQIRHERLRRAPPILAPVILGSAHASA